MCSQNTGRQRVVRSVALVTLVLSIAVGHETASAQAAASVIHGIVTDSTGGALPGVTVTMSSPALQVGQQVVVTGVDGSYRFAELPAGVYRITFALQGFSTFVRDELRLTIGFTARVDATMSVSQVQETVTVSGAAPVVDLTSSGTKANFTTEMLQAVPRSRDLWMVVDMAPGVARPGAPDVGGTGMAGRRAMGAYGDPAPQPKLEVEGINIVSGGIAQSSVYFNDFGFEEVQFKTSGTDAEMGTPGLHMVAVLKSGGNQFHGRYEGSYQGPSLQSNNLTDSLKAQGLSDTQPLKYAFDLGGDVGGRIIRDKLWFYGGLNTQNRKTGLLGFVSGPGPDGVYLTGDEPLADYDNTLRGGNVKLSWQLSKNNRVTGVYMRGNKLQPQESAGRFRPLEATRDYVNLSEVKKVEWQSTVNSRSLINFVAGYGGFWGDYNAMRSKWYPGTPSILHRESGLRTGSDEASDQRPRYNWQYDGSFTYLPARSFAGSHELKTGATMYQYVHGSGLLNNDHGNYVLVYDGAQPAEIQIFSNPVVPRNRLNTYAWYLKDTWRLTQRVTANLGIRFERQDPFIPAQTKEASAQFPQLFPAVDFPETHLFTWNRFLPRAGVSWSLNDRTVLKMSAGIYNYLWDEEDAGLYNPNAGSTATFRWTDPDQNGNYTPGEVNLNVDGPAALGISAAANRRVNQDLVQPKTTELTASFERELFANMGVHFGYVFRHRQDYFSTPGPNELRPYDVYNIALTRRDPGPDGNLGTPDDGGRVTIYDYDAAYRGAAFVRNTLINSPNADNIQTVELAVTKRMSRRWMAQSSFFAVKNNRWIELPIETPNNANFPKDETWDWGGNVSGSYVVPGDVRISAFVQTKVGAKGARTNIFRAVDPDGGTPLRQLSTVTIRLEPLGSQRTPAMTSVNLRGGRDFKVGGGRSIGVDLDVFNLLNAATPSAAMYASGQSFGFVTEVLPARIVRIGGRFSF
jgi:hypothetical protein